MKLQCPYSGIIWESAGFATGHKIHSLPHPIFSLPLDNLIHREVDWTAGRLSQQEKTLLFLAILKASERVTYWQIPAKPSLETVEGNYLRLMKLTCWTNGILSPSLSSLLPSFHISRETQSLDNMPYWLQAWEQARTDWEGGMRTRNRLETQSKLEQWLEARIRAVEVGTQEESFRYLKVLANWADVASQFPKYHITHPFRNVVDTETGELRKESLLLSEYWKEIICLPLSKALLYPVSDIKALEDFLVSDGNLPDISSLYAGALVRRIRRMLERSTNYLGIELVELSSQEAGISSWETTESGIQTSRKYGEAAGKMDIGSIRAIESIAKEAPKEEPKERDFPNKISFLKARSAWKLAQQFPGKESSSSGSAEAN